MTTDATRSERIRQTVDRNFRLSVHPSFLDQYLPKALHNFTALKHPRLKLKVLAHLFHRLKLEPLFDEAAQSPYSNFLTLSPQQWSTFINLPGALYFLDEVKTTISFFKKKLLLSLLSANGYDFVIHRGNLYAPMLESIAVPPCSGELEQRICAVGKFLLEYLWTQQPQPLLQRLVLKFNSGSTWNFQHVIDPNLQQQLLNIYKHLLKETEAS